MRPTLNLLLAAGAFVSTGVCLNGIWRRHSIWWRLAVTAFAFCCAMAGVLLTASIPCEVLPW